MRSIVAKILLLTTLCVSTILTVRGAEKVTFEVSSPLTVAAGEMFRVEFSLNAKPDKGTFRAPSFEGFDVLAGPSEATGQSLEFINGTMTRSYNCTITYVLMASRAGTRTIGEATVEVDGKSYRTEALPVEIVDEGSEPASRPQSGGRTSAEEPRGDDLQSRIGERDILLRTELSRTTVYKNEPVHVVCKLYMRVPFVNYSFESMPSFNGFWTQNLIERNSTLQSSRETYDGRVYETFVLGDWLLYPQQVGTLTIDPLAMTVVTQVAVQSRRADPFFGSGREVYNVPRKVQSQRATVQVRELPAGAPASFSGAVGSFAMETDPPAAELAANSGSTCTVKISGRGNLTFVQAPRLPLPESFEQYNVKTTESINAAAGGISGYRQFEYPFIARAEGTYDIQPVEFTYFDPSRVEYVTLRSQPLTLTVTPDARGGADAAVIAGRGLSKEEVQLLGRDIRFISLGPARLRATERPLLLSGLYWAVVAGLLLGFAAAWLLLRKRIRDSRNTVLVRGRRASKVAVQRFRTARRFMDEQQRHAFYEEMLRALWGYVSDRFNIPVANLTKESVREELHKRGIGTELSQRFTDIITRCDEAQYSPSASASMNDIYAEGVDTISRIEGAIKK